MRISLEPGTGQNTKMIWILLMGDLDVPYVVITTTLDFV